MHTQGHTELLPKVIFVLLGYIEQTCFPGINHNWRRSRVLDAVAFGDQMHPFATW